MGMSDYDRFMEFLKHIKVSYEIKVVEDSENIWQTVIFTDDEKENKDRHINFTFDTFGKLCMLDSDSLADINIINFVPSELDTASAKWNTLKNLQPPIDDD